MQTSSAWLRSEVLEDSFLQLVGYGYGTTQGQ